MRHIFDIGGTEHLLWLAPGKGGYILDLDGVRRPVALEPLGDDRYRLTVDDATVEVTLAVDGDAVHIALDGAAHVVRYHDNAVHFGAELSGASDDVAPAPMPGSVVAVQVTAGQAVTAGDPLIVIESMKLETTIRAWRDGVIETVHVSQGQSFDRDAPLISLVPHA
jgi:acetyl/propionyl-CoA carboxylase alpha subunit